MKWCTITGYTNSITQLALKHKEMIRVIEVSIPQGMGGWWREGKCRITGYINSITQLAEAQGNEESDTGEHTPGNGKGGLVVFGRLCLKQQNIGCRSS